MPLTTYTAGEVLTAASLNANFSFAAASGLTLVKSQVIGSAVSSVTVTGAFSATYDNYLIKIAGGVTSGTNDIALTLGAAATGYYGGLVAITYATNVVSGATFNNAASWGRAANGTTTRINCDIAINNPFLTTRTSFTSYQTSPTYSGNVTGFLDDATSYTAFTLTSSTLTGGTIYVYGFANS